MTEQMQAITAQPLEETEAMTQALTAEPGEEMEAAPQQTVFSSIHRMAVAFLSRFNFGKTVLQALEQIKQQFQGQHIKAQISQITEEGETTVVSIDVLDELDDMPLCTLELECEEVDPSLQPGEVVHNLMC